MGGQKLKSSLRTVKWHAVQFYSDMACVNQGVGVVNPWQLIPEFVPMHGIGTSVGLEWDMCSLIMFVCGCFCLWQFSSSMLPVMFTTCYLLCSRHVTCYVHDMLPVMFTTCYLLCSRHVTCYVHDMLPVMFTTCYLLCSRHVTCYVTS